MQRIYPDLDAAHCVVLGSPVFFYGFSGTAKAAMDRAQALWARRYVLQRRGTIPRSCRGGWLVAVGATRGERLNQGMSLTAKYYFDALDIPLRGSLLVRGVDEKGALRARPDVLARARKLGQEIAAWEPSFPECG
jgi:multimeric flavodoxin WrbA